MPSPKPSPDSEHSEEARAFLQGRVALFWKVMFFISLLSVVLGAIGIVADPQIDFWINVVDTLQAGLFWQICLRGERSFRFSRAMEAGGLLINLTLGGFIGRYLSVGFSADHAFEGADGALMGDAFVSMLFVGGTTMMVAVRAALIPSSPSRTVLITAMCGVPTILITTLLVPGPDGGLAWRSFDAALLWLPGILALMWGFSIVTSTIISWVTYSLRAEVRHAQKLGQYVLEKKIGEGGMGEVYRARHAMMKRPSAIKLLRADKAGEAQIQRFEREVQLTARLTHPNTITIFDYGRTADGVFYYAMELLDGASLQRIVEVDGAQPAGRVVRILKMACGALHEAHGAGLIHRDIKPSNIVLCMQGGEVDVVKVLDFGLVKDLEVDGDVRLTAANTVTGTPLYMAPESILDPEKVDARTDIYALGAVAYFLLTGVEVFDGKSVVEVCGQHIHEQPVAPSERGVEVPADLEALVLACLAKDPADRPQSAAELRERVGACAIGRWQSADARAWWSELSPDLTSEAGPSVSSVSGPRTIAVKSPVN